MSKYYKAEDIQELITACMWRMTLAKERNGEGFVEYDKQIIDVSEFRKRLSNLPTIDIVRCGECEYCKDELIEEYMPLYIYCEKWNHETDFDGFCSAGERVKDEVQNTL